MSVDSYVRHNEHLSLPSEKKGDHAKGVNEPMSQNARPQVASRQHVSNSKNQAGHAGVHHSRWTLVVVSDSEEHGHHQDSDPICGLRTRTHVRRTREQVAPIADLFSECGKSPDDKKPAERHRHIASNCVYTTWR